MSVADTGTTTTPGAGARVAPAPGPVRTTLRSASTWPSSAAGARGSRQPYGSQRSATVPSWCSRAGPPGPAVVVLVGRRHRPAPRGPLGVVGPVGGPDRGRDERRLGSRPPVRPGASVRPVRRRRVPCRFGRAGPHRPGHPRRGGPTQRRRHDRRPGRRGAHHRRSRPGRSRPRRPRTPVPHGRPGRSGAAPPALRRTVGHHEPPGVRHDDGDAHGLRRPGAGRSRAVRLRAAGDADRGARGEHAVHARPRGRVRPRGPRRPLRLATVGSPGGRVARDRRGTRVHPDDGRPRAAGRPLGRRRGRDRDHPSQQWLRVRAEQPAQCGRRPTPRRRHTRPRVLRPVPHAFLDAVFPPVPAGPPRAGRGGVPRLFALPGPLVVRFLSERSSVADDLRIVLALQKRPFLAALVRTLADAVARRREVRP